MRRLMKFLHTLGAIGFMGAMACFLVLLAQTPQPSALSDYALMRGAMGAIATYVFLPSLALTLVAGLLAIAVTRAYHNAGWAWAKLATGVLVFEWGLVGIQGPMQDEAERSAAALVAQAAGTQPDLSTFATSLSSETGSLWVMMAIATFNVVFGIWRPKLTRLPD